jgi:hypothetical protein
MVDLCLHSAASDSKELEQQYTYALFEVLLCLYTHVGFCPRTTIQAKDDPHLHMHMHAAS